MSQKLKPQELDLLLSDGRTIRVQLTIRDSLAYESAARGRSWGPIQENAMRMQAIRAWSAARRMHPDVIGTIGWQQFVEGTDPNQLHLIDGQPASDDDAEDVEDETAGDLGESGRADQSTD